MQYAKIVTKLSVWKAGHVSIHSAINESQIEHGLCQVIQVETNYWAQDVTDMRTYIHCFSLLSKEFPVNNNDRMRWEHPSSTNYKNYMRQLSIRRNRSSNSFIKLQKFLWVLPSVCYIFHVNVWRYQSISPTVETLVKKIYFSLVSMAMYRFLWRSVLPDSIYNRTPSQQIFQ